MLPANPIRLGNAKLAHLPRHSRWRNDICPESSSRSCACLLRNQQGESVAGMLLTKRLSSVDVTKRELRMLESCERVVLSPKVACEPPSRTSLTSQQRVQTCQRVRLSLRKPKRAAQAVPCKDILSMVIAKVHLCSTSDGDPLCLHVQHLEQVRLCRARSVSAETRRRWRRTGMGDPLLTHSLFYPDSLRASQRSHLVHIWKIKLSNIRPVLWCEEVLLPLVP
jgi:hypothetical protein